LESHAPNPSATALLRSPDQLKNTFTRNHYRGIIYHPAIKNDPGAIYGAARPIMATKRQPKKYYLE